MKKERKFDTAEVFGGILHFGIATANVMVAIASWKAGNGTVNKLITGGNGVSAVVNTIVGIIRIKDAKY